MSEGVETVDGYEVTMSRELMTGPTFKEVEDDFSFVESSATGLDTPTGWICDGVGSMGCSISEIERP